MPSAGDNDVPSRVFPAASRGNVPAQMDAPQTSDLLRQAQEGSRDALNALYERCAGRLLAYIRLRLGRDLRSRLESRDILQATMLKSMQHLDELRGTETRSLMAWLTRIAEHEIRDCADYQKRQRRDAAREVALGDDAPLPALTRSALSRVILNDDVMRLEEALDALTAAHREIILLRKFEELPFGEIARRLGKSEDACRMLLARAMTALTMKMSEISR
jgi:RNA polymerase sigma-70 factor, ECF subfamily